MEHNYNLVFDGQAVYQADWNDLGTTAALADDRVLQELLRMPFYNGTTASRGILRYDAFSLGLTPVTAQINPNGATGSVLVKPFRALIGSRTVLATDARKNMQDVRSGLNVADGATVQDTTVSFGANSSGNPRWDAVYAVVSLGAAGPTVTRKVKDPSTAALTSQSVSTYTITSIAVATTAGTAAASPVFPAIPSDSGSNYYIILGYVRIPNGFSGTSTVATSDICDQAPVLSMSRALGVKTLEPANQSYVLSTAQQQAWGSTGTRPVIYMPPGMTGESSMLVAVDLTVPTHTNGQVVDSRDWRGRLCFWQCAIGNGGSALPTGGPAWGHSPPTTILPDGSGASGGNNLTSNGTNSLTWGYQTWQCGIGNTMYNNGSAMTVANVPAASAHLAATSLAASGYVALYADPTNSGKLTLAINGTPGGAYIFKLDFSAPFGNL